MAEQINKNDYINHPDRIGGFNYYSLGETTIKQLQQNNLISSKTRKFQNKKPDAIVTDDEKDIVVYIENKDIGKLSTADDIQSAIDQYEDEGNSDEYVLDFYLGTTGPREKIKSLFPEGVDGTTVVNGDVFHAIKNKDGEYVVNIRFTVEPILRSKIKGRMGHDGQNEFTKLPGGTIERVKISIPIKEDGSFDLEAQQEIANKYRKIQQINSSIYQQIDELINIKIAL